MKSYGTGQGFRCPNCRMRVDETARNTHSVPRLIEEGVYEVDLHGNFLYFNNSLCKIFGYPREDIQFHNFSRNLGSNLEHIINFTAV